MVVPRASGSMPGMELPLSLPEHVEALRAALAAFAQYAEQTDLDAPVPTCPDWTVRDLIAHQGMVHRWARASLRGRKVDAEAFEEEGRTATEPILWLHDGGLELVETIQEVADDVHAPVFLRNAPAPRHFWARRQCHETTIHAVDALAAFLGHPPRAAGTWIRTAVAVDGIDELVRGFLPRSRSRLRSDSPVSFAIHPTDAEERWQVQVSQDPPVVTTERAGHRHEHADVVLKAPATVLYLALWNRTDELRVEGFDLWRRAARVEWS